jgi:predicted permease
MDTIIQDLRFAFRTLARQRGMTAVAVACLALGIGANTAIFSVVRAVLVESLPYGDASRLVRVYETAMFQGTRGLGSVSVPNFVDWRAQQDAFEGMTAYSVGSFDLVGGGAPERVRGVRANANLFAVLRAKPELGRAFALDEDQPEKNPVVVLSDGFWRRRFGGDRAIIGKTINLDNTPRTVIGVMPPEFDFPISPLRYDVWMPLVWAGGQAKQRGNHWMSIVARLKSGLDSAQATARMASIAARIAHDFPEEQRERGISVNTLNGVIVGRIRTPLLMLLGAVGLVLLIACANVANLLLARASGRRREVAVRTALGAERQRLVRQFLTESILLAGAGGVLGLLIARWGLRAILAYAAASLPKSDSIGLNASVLLFVAAVSIATGIGFGLVPALRASQTDLREDLSESAGRSGTARGQHRTLSALIVAEIALSLVLLVGAGLLVRGFVAIVTTDPGLRPERILTFHVSAPAGRMADTVRYVQFYGPALERVRALPGVRGAATTTLLPIQGSGWNGNFQVVGGPKETDPSRMPFAEYRVVSSNYFSVLGISLTKGREFTEQDAAGAPQVVMINDEFVRRYFPNEDPIGKQILAWNDKPSTIVGIAHSVRQVSLDQAPRSELYVPAAQTPGNLYDVTYIVATPNKPEAMTASVRTAIHDLAPDQPIFLVKSMDEVISDSLQSRKLTLSLLGIFAALALVLSASGVYGVMSYGVSQRRREIGIRMALGASATNVTRMVVTDGAKLAALGVAIGLAAAWALTHILTGMLYEVSAHDPATFIVVALAIASIAILASLVPALRASRVDPLLAMRAD